MDIYKINDIAELLDGNTYPGRGIVIGKTADGTKAVAAYFIMGRSANSRNRVFTERDGAVFTEPFDASKVEDPSLIIYAAVREYENKLIVTNGDQTDTVYEGLQNGVGMFASLTKREFEPDAPNLTPRISGMLTFENGDFTYVGERAITPRKYIDELHGAEKSIFKRLYAGRVSQKLYRLYEYEKL